MMNSSSRRAVVDQFDFSDCPFLDLGECDSNSDNTPTPAQPESRSLQLKVVDTKTKAAFDQLHPIRCFNYQTQLCVAARIITESIQDDATSLLILDKNAESALQTLEGMGFSLRQAVLDRKIEIYYYRHDVRERTFFKNDYEAIFNEFLKQRVMPVNKVAMVELDTLFGHSVNDAVSNQIEDFCNVARGHNIDVWGLYSPPGWTQEDLLSDRLSESLGQERIKQAQMSGEDGKIELTFKSLVPQKSPQKSPQKP